MKAFYSEGRMHIATAPRMNLEEMENLTLFLMTMVNATDVEIRKGTGRATEGKIRFHCDLGDAERLGEKMDLIIERGKEETLVPYFDT